MIAAGARALQPGDFWQSYQIADLLTMGGRSIVYRALSTKGAKVVLKIGTEALSDVEAARVRRALEQTAPLPEAPELERTLEAGVADGRLWCATEALDGQSLETLLARSGRLPAPRAARIARQVGRGIACIHSRGLLYRTLKPSNVMILDGDHVKVLDVVTAVTARPDRRVGTPHNLSPEEFSGNALDERADVYSLGSVLFTMIEGRPPFEGSSQAEVRNGTLHSAPPKLTAPVAEQLAAVIACALAKQPEDRHASMAVMARALDVAAAAADSVAPSTPRAAVGLRIALWALATAIVLATITFVCWWILATRPR